MISPDPPLEMTIAQRVDMTASGRDADAIPKVPGAGEVYVDAAGRRLQRMHNGVSVVADGYCGPWMTGLIERCRGHHEPQEELAFHSVVETLPERAAMVEIGGNWSYYSLWFLNGHPGRRALIVEPDPHGAALAAENLALNGLTAEVVRGYIGDSFAAVQAGGSDPAPRIDLADLFRVRDLAYVDLLHCDAQGAESELLDLGEAIFAAGKVGWLFLSTHGAPITGDPLTHQKCLAKLQALGAVIEAEHDVQESFSGDGLIVARFAPAPPGWAMPKLSRNRYSTSFYRNPLYDVAAASELVALLEQAYVAVHGAPSPEFAGAVQAVARGATTAAEVANRYFAAKPPPKPQGAIEAVGVWLELQAPSALGGEGDRVLTPTDTVMLPYLLEHGQWQTEPLDLARACLDPAAGYVLVDIGANIGMFARQFLTAFPAIHNCLCVEPDPRNLDALAYNLRPFQHRGLQIFPVALGAEATTIPFYRDADNIGNYSLNVDAMRNRRYAAGEIGVVDAQEWANQHLAGFDRLILKTDTQGSDELIATRIPLAIWSRIAFACLEIWRIEKPAYDKARFRDIIESFPHRSFRGVVDGPVANILDFTTGTDWMFYDLYLWR